ncbi:MAG: hypothetical protein R3F59_30450 [Myxococcota bacterium]
MISALLVLSACHRTPDPDKGEEQTTPADSASTPMSTGETATLDTGAPGCVPPGTATAGCDQADDGSSLCWLAHATWTAGGPQWIAAYGLALGDSDGDGQIELLMGAQGTGQYEGDVPHWGTAYLASASLAGPHCMADATATFMAQNTLDFFGAGVAFDDADGDGRDDLLIGSPAGTTYSEGRAYLLLGPVSSQLHVERTADAYFTGPAYGEAGYTVRIQDLDGDGTPDLGIRNRKGGDGLPPQVAILDVVGPRERTMADAKAVLEGDAYWDGTGIALEALDDVDGDGVGDLAVSAPQWSPTFDGRVYVLHGPTAGSIQLADADAIVTSAVPGAYLGMSMAARQDLDGDGLADVVAGALSDSATLPSAHRPRRRLPGQRPRQAHRRRLPIQLQGDHPFSQLGANLASPGDIDGDGEPDLVVSAPDNWNFSYEPGRIYIFRGPLLWPLTTADAAWVLHGDAAAPEGAGFGPTGGLSVRRPRRLVVGRRPTTTPATLRERSTCSWHWTSPDDSESASGVPLLFCACSSRPRPARVTSRPRRRQRSSTPMSTGETTALDTGGPGCVLPGTATRAATSPTTESSHAGSPTPPGRRAGRSGSPPMGSPGRADGDGQLEILIGAQGTGDYEENVPPWGTAYLASATVAGRAPLCPTRLPPSPPNSVRTSSAPASPSTTRMETAAMTS